MSTLQVKLYSTVLGIALAAAASSSSFAGITTTHLSGIPLSGQGDVVVDSHSQLLTDIDYDSSYRNRSKRDNYNGNRRWSANRDGKRCRSRSGNCQHYHNGFYYSNPWWLMAPLVAGSVIVGANNDSSSNYGGRHVEWCSDRYRSYDARNNTWVSYGGQVRECNSPY